MKPCRHIVVLFLVFWCLTPVAAQDQILYDQYRDLSFYNPSVSNVDGDYHHYVQVWSHAAIEPKGYVRRYDADTYENIDVGARYQGRLNGHLFSAAYHYDGYSFFHQHTVNIGYGYQFVFRNIHRLSVGGRLQVNFCDIMPGKLAVQTEWLKDFQMTPDFDLGIQYRMRGLNIGVSVVNIAGNSAANNTSLIMYERRGYFNISYDFALGKGNNIVLSPHLLFYLGQHTISADFGADINFWKYAHIGYTFRIQEMRHIVTVGMEYKGVVLDMAFDGASKSRQQRLQLSLGYKF